MAPDMRVAVTPDIQELSETGRRLGIGWLDQRRDISWSYLPEIGREVPGDLLRGVDAAISLRPAWTRESFRCADRLVLLSRWGVGVDHVDLKAATEAGVAVTITPDAIGRPMASANLTFILALTHRLPQHHAAVREGHWQRDTYGNLGAGLTGLTVGSVGLGNIAAETFRLLVPFETTNLAYSPTTPSQRADDIAVRLVDLATLMRESDVVMINCPLTDRTSGLIGAEELALVRPGTYLVNVARGPIVDAGALLEALDDARLAGAALDVFSEEPLPTDHPFTKRDDVILAPHSLGVTRDLCQRMGVELERIFARLMAGRQLPNVVNEEVIETPRFAERWSALRDRLASPNTSDSRRGSPRRRTGSAR